MKTIVPAFYIILTTLWLGFLPRTHAVSPAPDGGYPGGNTAEGQAALLSLTTGGFNTAAGFLSLRSNTAGQLNTATGAGALLANTADNNTAIGAGALLSNTTGAINTASGAFALSNNTDGGVNTATGFKTLFHTTTGGNNTADGANALLNNTTGGINTAIGVSALLNNTTGNLNTALGAAAGNNVLTANNVICIGAGGADVSNTTWIGNVYNTTTISGTTLPVVVSDSGQLGTAASSARFKKEIKPMAQTSETILALKPVTFHYKSDTTNTPQFGLIAEEVAEVNPDLVVRDKDGDIYTVRYDAVNAMLLNEFLKEHKTVQELRSTLREQEAIVAQLQCEGTDRDATISDLKKAMETVVARLKEQDPKIQNAHDQLEMSESTSRVAVNEP